MKITQLDLMKLASAFEGEFSPEDFSEEELFELMGLASTGASAEEIRRKYFEFHDDIKDRTLDKHKWSD